MKGKPEVTGREVGRSFGRSDDCERGFCLTRPPCKEKCGGGGSGVGVGGWVRERGWCGGADRLERRRWRRRRWTRDERERECAGEKVCLLCAPPPPSDPNLNIR